MTFFSHRPFSGFSGFQPSHFLDFSLKY